MEIQLTMLYFTIIINQKKKRRAQAANYLIEGKDKYILRYPEEDLVKILKDSGYHSEEWEETDSEEDWLVIQPAVVEDEEIIEEAITKKSSSIYIYEKWWRSSTVCIYLLFYQFYLSKSLIVIYLFKLLRLLHDRIDPTVELLKKKPPTLKRKRAQSRCNTSSIPPIGAPSWCLNEAAIKKFNRSTSNIIYDYNTEDHDSSNNDSENDTTNDDENRENRKRKKSSEQKRKKKSKKSKRKK